MSWDPTTWDRWTWALVLAVLLVSLVSVEFTGAANLVGILIGRGLVLLVIGAVVERLRGRHPPAQDTA